MADGLVRTTIYFDPALHTKLRLRAATDHRSLSSIVSAAVEAALGDDREPPAPTGRLAEEAGRYQASSSSGKTRHTPKGPPLRRPPLPLAVLRERWRHLPHVDPVQLRADIDELLDTSL